MISISSAFKTAMKAPFKELKAYIKLPDNTYIRSEDDLISVRVSGEGALCKTLMKKFEGKFLGEYNLLGLEVNVGIGVKVAGGTYEYIDYGKFLITETTSIKESETTTVVGYDLMIKTMKAYEPFATYPINLIDFAGGIAGQCGLTLGNTVFVNSTWSVPSELYENIKNISYRDIITQIAEASGSIAMIGSDDKLYFKSIYDTAEQITYENLFKLKLEPEYGPINSVVLSRQPQEDNIALVDQASIDLNGLTEVKISNNWLVDHNREDAITPIFNQLEGIRYYPFEASTEGLGWYEVGDMVEILNDQSEAFGTMILSVSILVDGGIKETFLTKAISKTATNYSYAGTVDKRLTNTEIKVDKQGQEIVLINEALVNTSIIYKQEEPPLNPVINDLWLNLSNNIVYRFDGVAWLATSVSPDTLLQYYTKSEIELLNESITSTVSNLSLGLTNNYLTKEQVEALTNGNSDDIDDLFTKYSEVKQVADAVNIDITTIKQDGTTKLDTKTGFKFDSSGLQIDKGSGIVSLLDDTGLYVNSGSEQLLKVNNQEINAKNVVVRTWLTVGNNARFEDYEGGVGIFILPSQS
ncbi:MAG: PblB [Fusobacteria bacterium]|nr:MAG: PblB [Fusobacteriota bacterium]KAF0228983.1 MAG: hypothetical protein FD182_1239 [Fusobacteriota bacterium]